MASSSHQRIRSSYACSVSEVAEQFSQMQKMEPSQPATLMENYYYPCDEVIEFEKKLIKHSIVWDYAKNYRTK